VADVFYFFKIIWVRDNYIVFRKILIWWGARKKKRADFAWHIGLCEVASRPPGEQFGKPKRKTGFPHKPR
jgi:hypothetical protein